MFLIIIIIIIIISGKRMFFVLIHGSLVHQITLSKEEMRISKARERKLEEICRFLGKSRKCQLSPSTLRGDRAVDRLWEQEAGARTWEPNMLLDT